jgi:Zinc-finger of the MIZ type in Nse subunit
MEQILEERRALVEEVLFLMETEAEREGVSKESARSIVSQKLLLGCTEGELAEMTTSKLYRKTVYSQAYQRLLQGSEYEGVLKAGDEASVCAITQRKIEDGVAAPCGHVFEREGVVFYFKGHKGALKCPYLGCKGLWENFLK